MGENDRPPRRQRRAADGVLPPLPECEKAGQFRQRRGVDQLGESCPTPAPQPDKEQK